MKTMTQQPLFDSPVFGWYINILHSCLSSSIFSSSQEQVAPFRPPDHLRRPVRHCCGAEFFAHRLHPASQRELWPTADLSGAHGQRHLQVYGHLHHGVCGLHDWHVQPVLILPWSQVQSCLHHVSYSSLWEWQICVTVWLDGGYVNTYICLFKKANMAKLHDSSTLDILHQKWVQKTKTVNVKSILFGLWVTIILKQS